MVSIMTGYAYDGHATNNVNYIQLVTRIAAVYKKY